MPKLEDVAEGVWLLRGGFPFKVMNVYLIADGDGVVVFDTGIHAMRRAIASAARRLGGIRRIVLGHAHPDHRGSAPYLAAPVFCHPDDVADAESDGGRRYYDYSLIEWPLARLLEPKLIDRWDGGPVKISGTVTEGDEVAGFRVFHFPGHAPGQIGLIREGDGVALVSDTIYTLNPETGRRCEARTPHPAFNENTEQARESIRKLARLEPSAVWPGHADPVLTDIMATLLRAAEN